MIVKVEIDPETGEATFYYEGDPLPHSWREYRPDTPTRDALMGIEETIFEVNENVLSDTARVIPDKLDSSGSDVSLGPIGR